MARRKRLPRQSHRLWAKAGWQWTFSHCGTCCAGRKYTSVRELGAQDESSLWVTRADRQVFKGVARQELLEEVGGTAADLRYVGQFYTTNGISNEVAHVVAEETIQKMDNIAREYQLRPWHTSLMEAWQARIWLAQDKLEVAFQRVRERGLDADKDLTDQDEIAYITLARILIAQGRLERATRLLRRLLEAAGAGERITRAIGLTNREVASRLFISLNTVKAHCRNIHGKLGVNNRTQAIGRARALGILPST